MTMGEKIRQARQEARLSQRQLCQGIVTRNMLSQIENGSANPSLPTLQALAQRLGRSVQYFLEEGEAPALLPTPRDDRQDDSLLLCWALAALRKQEPERAEHLLAAVESPGGEAWHFVRGCLLTARGDYAAAAVHLRRGEGHDPRGAWAQLEICCRETGDFKGAYLYACKLREEG